MKKRTEHLLWWAQQFQKLSKITLLAVEEKLRILLKTRTGKTAAHYVDALTAMMTWCVERKLLLNNPISYIRTPSTAVKSEYRAMTPEEIKKLLVTVVPDRRLVYELGLCSGLRKAELHALVVADLNPEQSCIRLRPEWTKNRKPGFQPIPNWLTAKLTECCDGKPSSAPLLPGYPDSRSSAKVFKLDCRKAGIETKDSGAGRLVFHSLRVTFLTLCDCAGHATPKAAQALARHQTALLTYARYVKAVPEELARVVESVGKVVHLPQ